MKKSYPKKLPNICPKSPTIAPLAHPWRLGNVPGTLAGSQLPPRSVAAATQEFLRVPRGLTPAHQRWPTFPFSCLPCYTYVYYCWLKCGSSHHSGVVMQAGSYKLHCAAFPHVASRMSPQAFNRCDGGTDFCGSSLSTPYI